MAVIEVHELHKRYGDTVALDGISFEVEAGEVFGLLGPNGAGKTTAVEITEGLRRADSGTARPTSCTCTPSSASTTGPPRWPRRSSAGLLTRDRR